MFLMLKTVADKSEKRFYIYWCIVCVCVYIYICSAEVKIVFINQFAAVL